MNHKLIKASLAGTAAVALVAGGSTFAEWSDFGTASVAAGSGSLKIGVGESVTAPDYDMQAMAPGQMRARSVNIVSADAGNAAPGILTARISGLVDTEDGATCTTPSEAVAEGAATPGPGSCGTVGELSAAARLGVLVKSVPAGASGNAASCDNNTGYGELVMPTGATVAKPVLASTVGATYSLGTVLPGDRVCVRQVLDLPVTATNATQGDDVSWSWTFTLTQQV